MTLHQAAPAATGARRAVRALDVDARDLGGVANAIEDLYAATLDVVVVRGAFDAAALAETGERLDAEGSDPGWSRPNVKMPVEDLELLGTDTPATPTFQAPRGATLDDYLRSAVAHAAEADAVFAPGFDAAGQIRRALARHAGGRPVALAQAADGRAYVPYTVRRIADGRQIGLHHDYHYRLELYRELSQQLDTGTLISYVATLRAPLAGGELFVYGATSDDTAVPRLANGFSYDLAAVEAAYDCARLVLNAGDLFLLASGRCLHRVGRVAGPRARITMGGFLALDKARERVLFWS
jgi:hypothetical protein